MKQDRQRMEVEKNKELEEMKYRFFTPSTQCLVWNETGV